jgi:hypothetical protein
MTPAVFLPLAPCNSHPCARASQGAYTPPHSSAHSSAHSSGQDDPWPVTVRRNSTPVHEPHRHLRPPCPRPPRVSSVGLPRWVGPRGRTDERVRKEKRARKPCTYHTSAYNASTQDCASSLPSRFSALCVSARVRVSKRGQTPRASLKAASPAPLRAATATGRRDNNGDHRQTGRGHRRHTHTHARVTCRGSCVPLLARRAVPPSGVGKGKGEAAQSPAASASGPPSHTDTHTGHTHTPRTRGHRGHTRKGERCMRHLMCVRVRFACVSLRCAGWLGGSYPLPFSFPLSRR